VSTKRKTNFITYPDMVELANTVTKQQNF